MKCHITLVHGTFAPEAAWTLEDSKLRAALQHISTSNVVIHRHDWSGSNTHTARFDSALSLAAHIKGIAAHDPQSRQVVVCHSHGGNIALYALKDPAAFEAVDLVVCISTPFIQVQPRSVALWKLENFQAAILIITLAVAITYAIRHMSVLPLALYYLLRLTLPFVETAIWQRMGTRALEWYDRLALPVTPAKDLLIIRTTGDEASASLGGVHFLSWLSAVSLEFAPRHSPATAWWRPLLLVVSCLGIAISTYVNSTSWFASIILVGRVLGIVSALLLAVLVIGPVLSVVCYCIVSLAYGPELLLAGALLEITAEPTPNGAWTLYCFTPELPTEQDEAFSLTSMRHSAPYEDPRVVELIKKRVSQVCDVTSRDLLEGSD